MPKPTASAPSATDERDAARGHAGEGDQPARAFRSCRRRRGSTIRPSCEPYDPVGPRGELGAVGDQQHRAPGPKPLDRLADELGALRIEVGGRLVEDHERRVAEERARERDPLAAGRPRAAARRRRRPCRSRPAARGRTRPRRRSRPRPAPRRRSRPGTPSRMLSATVPRKSVGCCGTQATCARHDAAAHAARSTSPAVTRPPSARRAAGAARRSCSCRRRSGRRARRSRPGGARDRRASSTSAGRVG